MALPTASDNDFPSLLIKEGSAPTTPGAGDQRLFIDDSDHLLKYKNSSGAVSDVGGAGTSVATDAIWTTAGKAAIATGTSTATEQWPPGHEFDYVEKTTNTSITNTSIGTANTILTGNAVTYDGSTTIFLEFYAELLSAASFIYVSLFDGGTSIGDIFSGVSGAGTYKMRVTPTAGAHTYHVGAYVGAGTGTVQASNGGSDNYVPCYLRQTKA